MGGEFPPHSLTVLTAAYWSDVASLLKRDTPLAVQVGVRGCRAGAASSLSVWDRHEDKETCEEEGVQHVSHGFVIAR